MGKGLTSRNGDVPGERTSAYWHICLMDDKPAAWLCFAVESVTLFRSTGAYLVIVFRQQNQANGPCPFGTAISCIPILVVLENDTVRFDSRCEIFSEASEGGPDARAGQVTYVIRDIRPEVSSNAGAAPAGLPFDLGAKEVISIDLYELLELGDLSLNVLVGDGDVVNVPEAKRFPVIGFARDPGSFALKKPTTVLEGIAMARGFQEVEASKRDCVVKRKTPDGEYIIPVDLVDVAQGKAPNFYLQPDDIIYVRQTTLRRTLLYTYDIVTKMFTFTGRLFSL